MIVAQQCKELGNKAYRNKDYVTAAARYTDGMILLPASESKEEITRLRFHFRMNRSKAFFQFQEYALAFAEIFSLRSMELFRAADYVFALKLAGKCRELDCFERILELFKHSSTITEQEKQQVMEVVLGFAEEAKNEEEKVRNETKQQRLEEMDQIKRRYVEETRYVFHYTPNFVLLQNLYPQTIESSQCRIISLKLENFKEIAEAALDVNIKETPGAGLGWFATNATIPKDASISTQSPILFASVYELDCDDCGITMASENDALRCCRCGVLYCGIECRKHAWNRYHRIMCENDWKYKEMKAHCRDRGREQRCRVCRHRAGTRSG